MVPNNRSRTATLLAALVAAGALATVFAPPAIADDTQSVRFVDDYDAALLAAGKSGRKVVLYFSASWCQWCRKMDVTTFADRRVAGLARQFVWVKVDAERQRELAARFGAGALPSIVVVNSDGEVLTIRGGYMTADQLLALLRVDPDKTASGAAEAVAKAAAALGKKLSDAASDSDKKAAVLSVVNPLAKAGPGTRQKALDAITSAGAPAWDGLLLCLSQKHLAVRAAAADMLSAATLAEIEFDTFAPPARRSEQIAQWKTWIDANRDTKPEPPSPTSQPAKPSPTKPSPATKRAEG